MTPLPGRLGTGEIHGWRIDTQRHAPAWDSGEGAFRVGGCWNGRGVRAVYASIDPATAIAEVAVHKGFDTLDTVPHVLTAFRIDDTASIHVVQPDDLPNPNWLMPGPPTRGQQAFGNELLAIHPFILIPSVVSRNSWNLIFTAGAAAGRYTLLGQERLAIDPRFAPPL
ncbi:RES domain-containing protein [Tistrella mobilis]|uniref:RES family NAD+ phosphorylase n=1 Tax=Tistrella mobilis TaxID=171437 RepID=UPI0035564B82